MNVSISSTSQDMPARIVEVPCAARRESDQYVCRRCRLRWDTNDPEPPRCERIPTARGIEKGDRL